MNKVNALMRVREVADALCISRDTVYRLVRTGLLPHPIMNGPKTSAWPSADIERIITARITARTEDEVRELVDQIHREREELAGRPIPRRTELPRLTAAREKSQGAAKEAKAAATPVDKKRSTGKATPSKTPGKATPPIRPAA